MTKKREQDPDGEGKLLVSACLAGLKCRYDGEIAHSDRVIRLVRDGRAIPVCPEQLGGMPTPRPAARFYGGTGRDVLEGSARLVNDDGVDVTAAFIRGAEETLKIARLVSAESVVLKERSPSCGYGRVRLGNALVEGNGVTAAMLLAHGIRVTPES